MVLPVKVLLPLSVRVPPPRFSRIPEPEIWAAWVLLALFLKTKLALLMMDELLMEALSLPLPIWRVPALIVVVPV